MRFFNLVAAASLLPFLATASPTPVAAPVKASVSDPFHVGDLLGKLKLLNNITLLIDINTAPVTNTISTSFVASNFLPDLGVFGLDIVFQKIEVKANHNGITYGEFTHTFEPPFRVPPSKSATSPVIPNVNLPQGFLGSLALLDDPVQQFNLTTTATTAFAPSWAPPLFITLPYNQQAIPFSAALIGF
jgi:hypothetical protein